MLIDLHILNFDTACHEGVSLIAMWQTRLVSELMGPGHAGMLQIVLEMPTIIDRC
jgi:hypothetical protein